MFSAPNGAHMLCCHRSLLHCVIANVLIILGGQMREEEEEMYSAARPPWTIYWRTLMLVEPSFASEWRLVHLEGKRNHTQRAESELAHHYLRLFVSSGALNHCMKQPGTKRCSLLEESGIQTIADISGAVRFQRVIGTMKDFWLMQELKLLHHIGKNTFQRSRFRFSSSWKFCCIKEAARTVEQRLRAGDRRSLCLFCAFTPGWLSPLFLALN